MHSRLWQMEFSHRIVFMRLPILTFQIQGMSSFPQPPIYSSRELAIIERALCIFDHSIRLSPPTPNWVPLPLYPPFLFSSSYIMQQRALYVLPICLRVGGVDDIKSVLRASLC